MTTSFFSNSLTQADPQLASVVNEELTRQQNQIELIASENIVSTAVLQAQGSVLTNKYAEGYPSARYYGGCEAVDKAEELAIERACKLFKCKFANVQPHSGSQANQAVFLALLKPGAKILSLSLDHGGHLTHGAKPNMSGKWFEPHFYPVDEDTHEVNYETLRQQALELKPDLIIAGYSAYPRQVDYAKFRAIADEVGAYLLVDMAHISGLVATGAHPSPLPHAHVVTTTTHKTLRGPRGGMILTNEEELAKKFNKAIFPGLQGGPLMHVIAAKAVAFGEALQPAYTDYINQVVSNAQALATTLQEQGLSLVTGGTDTHLVLLDLQPQNITGADMELWMDQAGLTVNKNMVPYDKQSPKVTSGVRIGTPAATTRGFGEAEFKQIALWIAELVKTAKAGNNVESTIQRIRGEVQALCAQFPIYTSLAQAA